jgi:hypothetical protein
MIALMCFMLALFEAAAVERIVQPYSEEMDFEVFRQRAPREEILKVRAHMISIGSMLMLALIVWTGRMGNVIP